MNPELTYSIEKIYRQINDLGDTVVKADIHLTASPPMEHLEKHTNFLKEKCFALYSDVDDCVSLDMGDTYSGAELTFLIGADLSNKAALDKARSVLDQYIKTAHE